MIEIYTNLNATTDLTEIKSVVTASLSERIDGEQTLSFTALHNPSVIIQSGQYAKYAGQWYKIVRRSVTLTEQPKLIRIDCEHASFELTARPLSNFKVSQGASVADILSQLLSGTSFNVGVIEPSTTNAIEIKSATNVRAALMELVAACHGNIEYNATAINIRVHRGSTTIKTLTDGGVVSFTETDEYRIDTTGEVSRACL
ncbi:hypothetical protein AGMMS49975_28400 [Clostridia bacterium]|nr:hypothetical protein AGMMS49975_28400 [Clostridia bacterium]